MCLRAYESHKTHCYLLVPQQSIVVKSSLPNCGPKLKKLTHLQHWWTYLWLQKSSLRIDTSLVTIYNLSRSSIDQRAQLNTLCHACTKKSSNQQWDQNQKGVHHLLPANDSSWFPLDHHVFRSSKVQASWGESTRLSKIIHHCCYFLGLNLDDLCIQVINAKSSENTRQQPQLFKCP